MFNQKIGNLLITAFVIVSFFMIMTPYSLTQTALQIGVDQHPLSFFIAPALYSYGKDLVPNVDYFTQYGTGLGPVFSYFLSDSPIKSYEHVVIFTYAATIFFLISYYFLSTYLLNSRAWAYCLALFALSMNFFGPAPLRGTSCWPVRYPLLGVFCLTYLYWCHTQSHIYKKASLFFLGFLAGISFFWCTEIGIYMICIGAFCIFFPSTNYIRGMLAPLIYIITSVTTFAILCVSTSNIHALSVDFVIALFKPALIYSAGFGFWPANWLSPYEFIFNVVIPIFLASTVIWTISTATTSSSNTSCKSRLLLLISLLGMAQLLKYWNMSLAAVWFSNSYLPLLVFAFWLKTFADLVSLKLSHNSLHAILFRGTTIIILLSASIAYANLFRDFRMDFDYGIRMYRYYPSILNKYIHKKAHFLKPAISFDQLGIVDSDVSIIKELTPKDKPVFIYSSRDWAYLLRARRAPGFPFIPSSAIPLLAQGEQWKPFLNADIIFLDTATPLWGGHRMSFIVDELLKSKYTLVKTGVNIKVYKRVT